MKTLLDVDVAKEIVEYCKVNEIKYIYISGNGASGKTELSKLIRDVSSEIGYVNTIDMDDFVVDTKLRKNSKIEWTDPVTGELVSGSYSTVFAASYFLQNINAIICNLSRGNNYWHWPKRAKTSEESVVEYRADAFLTIIEGIGSVHLTRIPNNSLSIFMQCSKEVEINRRVSRARFSNEQSREEVERQYDERNKQFEAIILPYASSHEINIESIDNHMCIIKKDSCNVFSKQ